MIISHKHKFIFLKTRKTAGTSIEIALSEHCGKYDIITPIDNEDEKLRLQVSSCEAQNFKVSLHEHSLHELIGLFLGQPRKTFFNHISAREVIDLIGPKRWNSYYKFCFERNPWDKTISHFFSMGGWEKFRSLDNYFSSGAFGRIKGFDLYSLNNRVAVDEVFRFENMNESLSRVQGILGLKRPISIKHLKAKGMRRTDRRHYSELLNREQKELIDIAFAREIKLLNYQF